MAEGYS